ncbi:hypothetical protein [Lyngbya sp. PCC 8106]|uniref:hypothetical protein n=1 Tax=Lyngbya sp. (strain PCC 8106) TaxID=313612 RepID=UPI0000EACDC3|nr:hypothetical protein [Lyngbya sp. PCC 8106]EAW35493.1 hypothetical protein L8106_10497 [Lyngbya sp. PCC 8106]
MKKTTWLSLFLLILTYITFGWTLFEAEINLYEWGGIITSVVILCLLFTTPINQLQKPIVKWFKTDFGTFISILLGSFLIVVIATYLNTFAKILLILSATTLVRMELQTLGIKNWSAFFILLITSLLGLGLGLGFHFLIDN